MATWRRWQYQVKAEAVGVPRAVPGSQYESQWHYGYTDPQTNFAGRLRAVAGVALIASGLFAPVLDRTQEPGNSYESTYHQPWSEPVRVQPREAYFEFATSGYPATTEPGSGYESQWHQPWSEPVRINPAAISRAYQQQVFATDIASIGTSGTATALVGGVADSALLPDRVFQYQATAGVPFFQAVAPFAIGSQWDGPIFSRTIIPQDIAFVSVAETITADKWSPQYLDFVRPKVGLGTPSQQALAHIPFVEDTTFESKWHQPWSEPVRQKPSFRIGTDTPPAFDPNPFIKIDWFNWLNEPVRVKPAVRTGDNPDFFFQPTPIIKIDWFNELGKPVRLDKPGLPSAEQQVLAHAPFNEDFSIQAKWYQPWSDPVRRKPFQDSQSGISNVPVQTTPAVPGNATGLVGGIESVIFSDRVFQYQGQAWNPFTPAATTPVAPVGSQWDGPIFSQVIIPQDVAFGTFQPIVNTADQWVPPWSEPVRIRPALRTGDNQDLFFDPQPFVSFPDKWGPQYPDFVKPKVSLGTPSQQFIAHVPFNEDSGIEAKWHFPWSEPVRVKPGLLAAEQQPFAWGVVAELVTVDKWFRPYEDPVRVKPGLRTGDNQDLFFDPNPFIKIDWFTPYQDPIKLTKPILITGANPYESYDPFPFTNIGWFNWLNEPIRLKPGLSATEQQFLAFDPQPFVKAMDWYVWLGEPKRFLAGLPTTEQQAFTAGFVPIIPSITNWYRPLEEPVRFRIYGVHLQSVSAWTPQQLANIIRFSRGYIIC